MSEYQYYEFVALDQPLNTKAQAERTEEEARRERDRTLAHERRLDGPAQGRQVDWTCVDPPTTTPPSLLVDLRALADREDRPDEFARRHAALRPAHKNKPSLIARLARVNL